MVLNKLRRAGALTGLCAALAMAAPVGVASASPMSGTPTPMTSVPALAAPVQTAATSSVDGVEVAQNRRQVRRQNRKTRRIVRNQNRRTRNVVRNQNRRDRIYRNGRWYSYRNGRYYDNAGGILAGVVIGGAAAAIAGSLATRDRTVVVREPSYGYAVSPYSSDWYRLCDNKYNSFRASDGTYLGYDGVRHTCRIP